MDVKAPAFPESISEGTVAEWHVQQGESARRDELLADIEADKVVIEVFAPAFCTMLSIEDIGPPSGVCWDVLSSMNMQLPRNDKTF